MPQELNPYAPSTTVERTTASPSRWSGVPSFVTGFFGGTALQWVLFWTDYLDTEFPPIGGAVLGVVVLLAFRYRSLRSHKSFLILGAIVGNLNAFWCNSGPLLYWNIPRDLVTSWTFASVAFVVALVSTFASAKLAERLVSQWRSTRSPLQ